MTNSTVQGGVLQIHPNTSLNYKLWPVDKSNKVQTQALTTSETDIDEVIKHMAKTEVIKHMSILPKNVLIRRRLRHRHPPEEVQSHV
jgi:hypothetical protein